MIFSSFGRTFFFNRTWGTLISASVSFTTPFWTISFFTGSTQSFLLVELSFFWPFFWGSNEFKSTMLAWAISDFGRCWTWTDTLLLGVYVTGLPSIPTRLKNTFVRMAPRPSLSYLNGNANMYISKICSKSSDIFCVSFYIIFCSNFAMRLKKLTEIL